MINTAFIAFGGNLGDVRASFDGACEALREHCNIIKISKLYQTTAVGPEFNGKPQPDYLNAAIQVETDLSATELLQTLHKIEAKHDRKRIEHWGARTLDLDLITYAQEISQTPELFLPHPSIAERLFVLQPLQDIQADWTHPVSKQSVSAMIAALQANNEITVEGKPWKHTKQF